MEHSCPVTNNKDGDASLSPSEWKLYIGDISPDPRMFNIGDWPRYCILSEAHVSELLVSQPEPTRAWEFPTLTKQRIKYWLRNFDSDGYPVHPSTTAGKTASQLPIQHETASNISKKADLAKPAKGKRGTKGTKSNYQEPFVIDLTNDAVSPASSKTNPASAYKRQQEQQAPEASRGVKRSRGPLDDDHTTAASSPATPTDSRAAKRKTSTGANKKARLHKDKGLVAQLRESLAKTEDKILHWQQKHDQVKGEVCDLRARLHQAEERAKANAESFKFC